MSMTGAKIHRQDFADNLDYLLDEDEDLPDDGIERPKGWGTATVREEVSSFVVCL